MSKTPDRLFEVTDHEDCPAVLSRETWEAKAGARSKGVHPEIREYFEDVRAAIGSPDLVFQSTRAARARIVYRLSVGREAYAGLHLAIVIKYVAEATGHRGYVSTMYLTRNVFARGVLLWEKVQKSSR